MHGRLYPTAVQRAVVLTQLYDSWTSVRSASYAPTVRLNYWLNDEATVSEGFFVILIVGFLVWAKRFISIDSCLDRGGPWNYEAEACDGATE